MRVEQCPKCELKFQGKNELRQHLVEDHAVDPDAIDPMVTQTRPRKGRRKPPERTRPGSS